MAKSKFVKANEKIAEGVVGGYKKIENGVVGAYKKVEDKFVDQYLTKDGESVEDAKARLKAEQKEREDASAKAAQERAGQSRQQPTDIKFQ
jgi:ribosomal protein L9